jgi:aryl-alcohol dehydrogenase-like predicted oxidoreductase
MPELGPLVLGTMTFGDTVNRDGAATMLDAALDAGITHVDTANGYAGGESERLLADLLRGRRNQVTLATKAGIPHPDAGEHSPLSAAGLRACVEGSLSRLQTDHIELFYLHQPDRAAPLTETLTAVAELVREG